MKICVTFPSRATKLFYVESCEYEDFKLTSISKGKILMCTYSLEYYSRVHNGVERSLQQIVYWFPTSFEISVDTAVVY